MRPQRHIAILGGGLAGLAAAVAASAAGATVTVHEAAPGPVTAAAHLDVVPNLLRDLVALGVGEACVRKGFPCAGMVTVDGEGRMLFDIPLQRLTAPAWPAALGMAYGDLLDVLRQAAQTRGTRLHHGQTDAEARHSMRQADFTLVACGARALPAAQRQPLPQQWCHALLPRPRDLERSTWVIGHRGLKAQVVPVGLQQAGVAVIQPLGAPSRPADLRAALAGQGTLLQGLAAHWHDQVPVTVRPVCSGLRPGAWHQGRTLYIGHSAHLLPPHFGQAAAQVLEDALVLGDLLRADLPDSELPQAFERRRRPRVTQVHALTDQAARWDLQPRASTDLPELARRLAPLVATPA